VTEPDTTEPVSLLFSFWYFRNDTAFRKITTAVRAAQDRGQTVRIMVDSGAFSADTKGHRIHVDEYGDWIRDRVLPEWGPWLVGCLNLDVLRDADASWSNWSRLSSRGFDTIPVVHFRDRPELMDRYVSAGSDYVALGAMVGESATVKLGWAAHVHRYVLNRHPSVRLHGLGVSGQRMVEGLPWWSVDSSSFGRAWRFGTALVYDRQKRKMRPVHLSGPLPHPDILRMIRDDYGLRWEQIRDSGSHNRTTLVGFAARSMLAWQHDLRRSRTVSPPRSKVGDGTHLTHAETSPNDIPPFMEAQCQP
jgi:hypothetical protein